MDIYFPRNFIARAEHVVKVEPIKYNAGNVHDAMSSPFM